MPGFPWLATTDLTGEDTATKMKVMRILGVPYTDTDIEQAKQAVAGVSELEALVAYLQGLGTVISNRGSY